ARCDEEAGRGRQETEGTGQTRRACTVAQSGEVVVERGVVARHAFIDSLPPGSRYQNEPPARSISIRGSNPLFYENHPVTMSRFFTSRGFRCREIATCGRWK